MSVSEYPAITELVPHAAPMLALRELVHWEPGLARARLVLGHDDLFVEDGKVDAVCALEYMAQGVAACLGQESWHQGDSVRVGMVIACRSMTLERPHLLVGEELLVEARRVHGTEHASHYDTALHDAQGTLVAKATMTLVHGEKPADA